MLDRDDIRHATTSPVSRLIDVLVSAMHEYDPDTAQHLERTAMIAEQTARAMRLPEPVAMRCRDAARVHDIGKIDLDLRILRKSGQLTRSEWELVKLHPARGERILSEIPILASLAPIVGAHHERFDGEGYPNNLAGTDIPLESRVIAVADAFEAMIGVRAYQRPRSFDDALFELAVNAGYQFDPDVVAAFLAMHEAPLKPRAVYDLTADIKRTFRLSPLSRRRPAEPAP